MKRNGRLQSVKTEFVRNLLRFQSGLLREKLLDSIRVAHTEQEALAAYPVSHVGQAVSPGVSSSDVHSGGESPLWTVMTGTIRLGKGARREAGSEES